MNFRTVDFRRILIYTAILSLFIYYVLSWARMIVNHYERTGSDFMGFYSFGWISERKGIEHIYSLEEQQKLQEQIVGHPVTPIFHTHVPLTAPLSMAVGDEDYVASFKRWAVVLLLLNAVNIYFLLNTLEIHKFTKANLIILTIGTYLFDPTFSGLMNGQDTAIVLLGAALWTFGFFSDKHFLAGVGLSLTTLRPQIALFLALPFVFHHRRVFWGFLTGSSVLVAISVGMLGYEGTLSFIDAIRYIETTVWLEAHALDMPTISGIIRRNFAFFNPAPLKNAVWLAYALGIAGFSYLWYRSIKISERHIGLLFIAGIFLVPYAHYHDLILLLIPIFCLLRIYQKEDTIHQNYLAIVPLAVSWFLTLGFAGSAIFKFTIVYLIMFTLTYLFVKAGKERLHISSVTK